jgi:hypothetical protein
LQNRVPDVVTPVKAVLQYHHRILIRLIKTDIAHLVGDFLPAERIRRDGIAVFGVGHAVAVKLRPTSAVASEGRSFARVFRSILQAAETPIAQGSTACSNHTFLWY